mmetsp:Transcript_96364/g.311162  ORF Transcript_96364/g.311162 Transcript_96364/m.311162 type:complete len:300 (+) Transcript_96364:299-1198(+)
MALACESDLLQFLLGHNWSLHLHVHGGQQHQLSGLGLTGLRRGALPEKMAAQEPRHLLVTPAGMAILVGEQCGARGPGSEQLRGAQRHAHLMQGRPGTSQRHETALGSGHGWRRHAHALRRARNVGSLLPADHLLHLDWHDNARPGVDRAGGEGLHPRCQRRERALPQDPERLEVLGWLQAAHPSRVQGAAWPAGSGHHRCRDHGAHPACLERGCLQLCDRASAATGLCPVSNPDEPRLGLHCLFGLQHLRPRTHRVADRLPLGPAFAASLRRDLDGASALYGQPHKHRHRAGELHLRL